MENKVANKMLSFIGTFLKALPSRILKNKSFNDLVYSLSLKNFARICSFIYLLFTFLIYQSFH